MFFVLHDCEHFERTLSVSADVYAAEWIGYAEACKYTSRGSDLGPVLRILILHLPRFTFFSADLEDPFDHIHIGHGVFVLHLVNSESFIRV